MIKVTYECRRRKYKFLLSLARSISTAYNSNNIVIVFKHASKKKKHCLTTIEMFKYMRQEAIHCWIYLGSSLGCLVWNVAIGDMEFVLCCSIALWLCSESSFLTQARSNTHAYIKTCQPFCFTFNALIDFIYRHACTGGHSLWFIFFSISPPFLLKKKEV